LTRQCYNRVPKAHGSPFMGHLKVRDTDELDLKRQKASLAARH
jgi:hypothetical protein